MHKNIIIDSPFVVLTVPHRPRIHLVLSGASIVDGSIALKQHAFALSYIHFYARRKRISDRISIIDVYLQHLHTRVTAIILLFAAIYCLVSHRITRDTCNIRSRVLSPTSPNIRDCRSMRRCVINACICKIHSMISIRSVDTSKVKNLRRGWSEQRPHTDEISLAIIREGFNLNKISRRAWYFTRRDRNSTTQCLWPARPRVSPSPINFEKASPRVLFW